MRVSASATASVARSVARNSGDSMHEMPRHIHPQSGRPRLLAIDDEHYYLSFIEAVAHEEGYDVQTLSQSIDFESVFGEFAPDVLLVDIMMPDFDGIEIARWFASYPTPKTIIFMSGSDTNYLKFAMSLANPYGIHSVHTFSKPIHLRPFRDLLLSLQENIGCTQQG